MSALEFEAWPKIARLRRPITITEKIDGTNAAIVIGEPKSYVTTQPGPGVLTQFQNSDGNHFVGAQSRTRMLSLEEDNFGFARWVQENVGDLVELLGPGRHFGEWWGGGVQRGYGVQGGAKRFSLFNVDRYAEVNTVIDGVPVRPVPTLARHSSFDSLVIDMAVARLQYTGSVAEPGYNKPEGVIVFHHASGHVFKRLIEGDDVPKGALR